MNDADRRSLFSARRVAAQLDQTLSVALLALAEGEGRAGRALIFQRSVAADGAASPGDEWSVSTELGATWYGGIVSWRLDGTSLHLDFADEAAAALDVPNAIAVELPDYVVEHVGEALRWILGGGAAPVPDAFVPRR